MPGENVSNSALPVKNLVAISIGLPVYNGGSTLRASLESLLDQTFSNFEIILSDNCSTDQTQAICEEFARKDKRITYIRQTVNIGAFSNFTFVLGRAKSEYFMWAAHDDFWKPSFIEKNLSLLRQFPDAVSAISKVLFTDGTISNATNSLMGNKRDRLACFIQTPSDNSRFYGIHRTLVVQDASVSQNWNFWAGDWTLVLELIARGNFLEVEEILMERTVAPFGRYYQNLHGTFFDKYFPMLRYSKSVLNVPGTRSLRVVRFLAKQNLVHHLNMAKMFGWCTARIASSGFLVVPTRILGKMLSD